MSVFSKFRSFLHRHRTKFVVSGVVITGSVLLMRYAQQRLKEWQDRETRDFLERTRKQQHFESTERTCNQTILNLLATLNDSLSKSIDTDALVAELRSNPENKIKIWEKLKVMVFTKVSTLIYLCVMLMLMLRIQLNIIGGYLCKDPNSLTTEMQQKYLLLCNNLFSNGLKQLTQLITEEYDKIFKSIDLKKQMKLKDLESVFWAVQSVIATNERNPLQNFTNYVLLEDIPNDNSIFSNMVRDTVDLLESSETNCLAMHCINRCFVIVSDQLSEYYVGSSPRQRIKEVASDAELNGFIHPSDVQIPMAKLIPIINGLVSKGLPDQIISQLIVNDRVKIFGANIYECFSNN